MSTVPSTAVFDYVRVRGLARKSELQRHFQMKGYAPSDVNSALQNVVDQRHVRVEASTQLLALPESDFDAALRVLLKLTGEGPVNPQTFINSAAQAIGCTWEVARDRLYTLLNTGKFKLTSSLCVERKGS